jgi:hypothetical protein
MADVLDALQLLLRQAYLESDFYIRGVAATGLLPASDSVVFSTIRDQESSHVATLVGLIIARDGTAPAPPAFDFTAKGAFPDFAFAEGQYETFKMLGQAFEDLGVRAFKGQLQALVADKVALNAALAIHSVEARHASEIRRLRGKKAWITGDSRDDLPAFVQAIYDGEENVTQRTVDVATAAAGFGGADSASEAFDEPLTTDQVAAIHANFLA